RMRENGWTFEPADGVIPDAVNQFETLHQVYTESERAYSGRVTVPVLWDKQLKTIVNNESSEIIRMFNSEFSEVGARTEDYYPEELRPEIDKLNERIYDKVNNGVYKAGFATRQIPYEEACDALFETLDWLEALLSERRYVAGDVMTEADIRLFTTLLRFDLVYYGHFKTNKKHIYDYENLWAFTRELYQLAEVKSTTNFEHIKRHYYESQITINPSGVYPKGPIIDFESAHTR
ncbi:MAG: glutathione S-transferase C-terminal domain-containing protein, partial [Pseudomonadota bacterium]